MKQYARLPGSGVYHILPVLAAGDTSVLRAVCGRKPGLLSGWVGYTADTLTTHRLFYDQASAALCGTCKVMLAAGHAPEGVS